MVPDSALCISRFPCELRRRVITIIVDIHSHGQADLAKIALAYRGVCRLPRAGESPKEHRGKDGDDGDDHEQLDQGESASNRRAVEAAQITHSSNRTV